MGGEGSPWPEGFSPRRRHATTSGGYLLRLIKLLSSSSRDSELGLPLKIEQLSLLLLLLLLRVPQGPQWHGVAMCRMAVPLTLLGRIAGACLTGPCL